MIVYSGSRYQRYSGGPQTPFEGVIVWRSFGTSGATPPPPPDTSTIAGGGNGGPTQIPWADWIRRHPWLLDVPLRPNWYAYPDQPKALKTALIKVAKKKRSIERDMQFAKGQEELHGLLAALNGTQEVLALLTEQYRSALNLAQARVDAEEEQEFMELLQELL